MRSSTNKLTSWGWSRIPIGQICAVLAVLVCWLPAVGGANAAVISEADLKARIEAATKDLKDLGMTANVVEVDRRAMEKLDANYARMLELKSAKITLKLPDKVRVDGKLGMVRFEYIINGTIKISARRRSGSSRRMTTPAIPPSSRDRLIWASSPPHCGRTARSRSSMIPQPRPTARSS